MLDKSKIKKNVRDTVEKSMQKTRTTVTESYATRVGHFAAERANVENILCGEAAVFHYDVEQLEHARAVLKHLSSMELSTAGYSALALKIGTDRCIINPTTFHPTKGLMYHML